jgi:hypothetical protein
MRRKQKKQKLIRQMQLAEWWRARAALNDRLADLMYSLDEGCPPEDFTAAIEEVRRLDPLFRDAPDLELDRLNHQRCDLIIQGFRYAEQGDFDSCFSVMDRVIEVTDQMTARFDLLIA